MKALTIDFFIWWYRFKSIEQLDMLRYRLFYYLHITRTLPMLQNIFYPLFGDNRWSGRFVGFFIRFWWIIIGGIITTIIMIPFVIYTVAFIALPIFSICYIFIYLVLI